MWTNAIPTKPRENSLAVRLEWLYVCFVLILLSVLSPGLTAAENAAWSALTEYGQPNLQGVWTNPSQTPLQRPIALGTQAEYTEDEAEAVVRQALAQEQERMAPLDPRRSAPPVGDTIDQQADGNFEMAASEIARVGGVYRTSLIVDPPDGRFPFRESWADIFANWRALGHQPFDGPEILSPMDRCLNPGAQLPLLTAFSGPASGNPAGDNPVRNIQIVQTADHVVILSEYFSLVRIIPLGSSIKENPGGKWMGDSIGHYEGNTLKINTRNFRPEQSTTFIRSSDELEISESFTLLSENELLFRFTVTDPKIYTTSFTAEIPLRRMAPGQLLYEYACHEGNYSLPSILRGGRMEEIR